VIIGAILTQNTAWSNVERAIKNLRAEKLLTLSGINRIGTEKLAQCIRPSGCYNIKAQRIKCFIEFLFNNYRGSLQHLFKTELLLLREQLLEVKGIGPETADSILLYAAGKPVFVVDAYTRRIFSRHGLVGGSDSYSQIQSYFMDNIKADTACFNEYHALIVRLAKTFCRNKPDCNECPLKGIK